MQHSPMGKAYYAGLRPSWIFATQRIGQNDSDNEGADDSCTASGENQTTRRTASRYAFKYNIPTPMMINTIAFSFGNKRVSFVIVPT